MEEQTGLPFGFESLLTIARSMVPELVEWITPEVEPGVRACWEAMEELEGSADAVTSLEVPVLLWDGTEDPHHDPMERFARAHALAFLSTLGDHAAAMLDESGEARKGLRSFLEAVPT